MVTAAAPNPHKLGASHSQANCRLGSHSLPKARGKWGACPHLYSADCSAVAAEKKDLPWASLRSQDGAQGLDWGVGGRFVGLEHAGSQAESGCPTAHRSTYLGSRPSPSDFSEDQERVQVTLIPSEVSQHPLSWGRENSLFIIPKSSLDLSPSLAPGSHCGSLGVGVGRSPGAGVQK